jgi:spore coat polysaccharide biosynthesis protein SpsF
MNRQETLWHGDFGTGYQLRNQQVEREEFWREVLSKVDAQIESVLELGAGQGDNLRAIGACLSGAPSLIGVDINALACEAMRERGLQVIEGSAHSVDLPRADLVLTRGFLIHVQPNYLYKTYARMHAAAKRFIAIAEYFSPKPREIPYRGKGAALWARDFTGDMLSAYSDLHLVDYGFVYEGDGRNDESLNWFLLEKGAPK